MSRRANKQNRKRKDRQSYTFQTYTPMDYGQSMNVAMGLSLLARSKKQRKERLDEDSD